VRIGTAPGFANRCITPLHKQLSSGTEAGSECQAALGWSAAWGRDGQVVTLECISVEPI